MMPALRITATAPVTFGEFDPVPPAVEGALADSGRGNALLALDNAQQYLFAADDGTPWHRYDLPDDSDVLNCGGYLDKLLKYRDPALAEHLRRKGVSKATFEDDSFPLLASRSPQLDLLLHRLLVALAEEQPARRVSLFDLGCTVAEHFDLLDIMLRASSDGRLKAPELLDYCGLDISALVLAAARFLHGDLDPRHFRLLLGEGSDFDAGDQRFDLSLSVGVIHNLRDPVGGTERMIRFSDVATVLACWACAAEQGIWLTSHHAAPIYVFGREDLVRLRAAAVGRELLVADFIPEAQSSQQRHFAGLSQEAMDSLGCYHLVVTDRIDLFPDLARLSL